MVYISSNGQPNARMRIFLLMPQTSPILHRAQERRRRGKLQDGTVLSVTTIAHPPSRFGAGARTVALIELQDGTKTMAALTHTCEIGTRVTPRLRLSGINEEALRTYDMMYQPVAGALVMEQNFNGYILALTGPSGVGKSTVSRLLVQMFGGYMEPVPIITTRKRKKGDDGEYSYVSTDVFEKWLKEKEIVAHAALHSRSEERLYGYRKKDIDAIWQRGAIPVVITEMHLLQGLAETFGRRSILSFGLLPPGTSKRAKLSALLHRLRTRGRETEEQMADRLKHAERDLAFFEERGDLFDHLLVNEDVDGVLALVKEQVAQFRNA